MTENRRLTGIDGSGDRLGHIGNVATLDDPVFSFTTTERVGGQTIIRIRS